MLLPINKICSFYLFIFLLHKVFHNIKVIMSFFMHLSLESVKDNQPSLFYVDLSHLFKNTRPTKKDIKYMIKISGHTLGRELASHFSNQSGRKSIRVYVFVLRNGDKTLLRISKIYSFFKN